MPRTSIGDVGYETTDGVARIILQAPGRGNTLTRATTKAFAQVVDAVLESVAEGDVDEEEVAGAVRRARRDHLSALAHLEERAEELAYAATVLGDPEALSESLDAYARVGPTEIQEAARQYLSAETGAVVTVIPRNGDAAEVTEVAR